MAAYYNEHDIYAAEWLRSLIKGGHIAPGDVDERSIEDVSPVELAGYTQCHFFAGIGIWSYALRAAGWPDDRPIWSGSCPCQPFSAAGEGAGFDDERHLWPAFYHLISERRPSIVVGEQVASKNADPWVDLVCSDLEAVGYAFGSTPFPAAGVGAPHIRDRNYWLACAGAVGTMGDAERTRLEGHRRHGDDSHEPGRHGAHAPGPVAASDAVGGMADVDKRGSQTGGRVAGVASGPNGDGPDALGRGEDDRAGPVNGFWRAADWLRCRDERWRPVEPGTFPLVTGAFSRMGRLRAYGNGLNAEAATEFCKIVMAVAP